MTPHFRLFAILLVAGLALSRVQAVEPAANDGTKRATVPERKPEAPIERGKRYPVPATKWEHRPMIWGWTCELDDGSGLAFGGVHQTADDGRVHTRVKVAGEWQSIIDEMRQNNPLQKQFEAVWALRNASKDTLARARHLYFEGKLAAEEAKILQAGINPAVDKLTKDLAGQIAALKALDKLDRYEAGQVAQALKRLDAAAEHFKSFDSQVTVEQLTAMRRGQIELERASEMLDAEPPPRALSLIAWDPKTKVYALFGGDHTDYVTNDLWIFDPAKRKWFQRHTEGAPEPRADHHWDALGDGRIAMFGGYTGYLPNQGYIHVGPSRWIYDIEKNTWNSDGHQDKLVAAGTRAGTYEPPSGPESYMKGPRPDAAAQEAKLKALPANTWVKFEPLHRLGSRDWATWNYDAERDMLYVFGGGHVSYAGSDVARYHLSTNRWEITDPVELPLGGIGSNEQYPTGFNFNRRPWVRPHVWNSQSYDPDLKRIVLGGATNPKIDPYFYLYDPEKADWVARHRIGDGMGNGVYGLQLRHSKGGMFGWYGTDAWLLDAKTLTWNRLALQGKMPSTGVDSCGMVYDAKRDRMLLLTLGGYGRPYDGQIHALDFAGKQIAPLNPEGMDDSKAWSIFLREAIYYPKADMIIVPQMLKRGGKSLADHILAYEPAKNRWVVIKTPGAVGEPFHDGGVSMSIHYDARRDLLWVGNAGYNGGIWAMRFDPSTAEIRALKDVAAGAPTAK